MADAPSPRISTNIGTYENFSDAWLASMEVVLNHGNMVTDDGELLREVLNLSLSAENCRAEDLIAVGADPERLELMVFKYGSQDVLPQYKISYGKLFRDHQGVDQLDWLAEKLRAKPEAKSATIGFHIPGSSELSCISLVDCKIRDSAVHLNAVFRSQNIYSSQPGNALALARLQREIATLVGVEIGYLTLHVMSAHIFDHDIAAAQKTLDAK